MNISENGLKLVKEFEGCSLHSYRCPAGVWTIGYGHTGTIDGKQIVLGMQITKQKANELLAGDMQKFEKAVEDSPLSFKPNQNQFDALVSFAFNCGTGNLKKLVKDRTSHEVSEALLLYNKAHVNGVLTVLSGLTRRRKAEQKLFNTAVKGDTSYYSKYSGKSGSIVDALISIGVKDTSFAARKKIATANSISGYTGTAAQNLKLLTLLKSGKLKKA